MREFFFFFSSRRRHTRLQGDWSSDVCSSDLLKLFAKVQTLIADAGFEPCHVPDTISIPLLLAASLEDDERLQEKWGALLANAANRSEEHTSELQSPCNLVCRLLLEKKK